MSDPDVTVLLSHFTLSISEPARIFFRLKNSKIDYESPVSPQKAEDLESRTHAWAVNNLSFTCKLREADGAYIRVEIWRQWTWPYSSELLAEGDVSVRSLLKNHCTLPALDSRRSQQAISIPLQSVNDAFHAAFIAFPETASPAHWRQLYAHHSSQLGALKDLLYLLERGKATTSARDDKWTNYCDTETLGILGELLRLWCIGALPTISKPKVKQDKLVTLDIDDSEGEESEDSESDEDDSDDGFSGDKALSRLRSTKGQQQLLESIVIKIWKLLSETPKMQVKLANIAFHLFLIDVLPMAFQQHPKHAFFLMELMHPYFTLENNYTKQFIVLFASLLSDTTKDFVEHYSERLHLLDASLDLGNHETEGELLDGSILSPPGSSMDLTSSGELDNNLASSTEMTRYMLETSLSGCDAAPRRARKPQVTESTSKRVLSKKQSERLVRQETRLKVKEANAKVKDAALRERARQRLITTLWQHLKYFDPTHLPILLRTKIIDDINTLLTSRNLPTSIVSLSVDAVKYIGIGHALTLSSKQVLHNMLTAQGQMTDANLKLTILDVLSQFASIPGIPSSLVSETAVINVYISEFARYQPQPSTSGKIDLKQNAPPTDPSAVLLTTKFIVYLQTAPLAIQKLAMEYEPSVSVLLGLLLTSSQFRDSALSLLPTDPSISFLLKTDIIEVFKRYNKSDDKYSPATIRLLSYIRKLVTTPLNLPSIPSSNTSYGNDPTSNGPSSSSSPIATASEKIPVDAILSLVDSGFFKECFSQLSAPLLFDSKVDELKITTAMLLDVKSPILDILILKHDYFDEMQTFWTHTSSKQSFYDLQLELLPCWLELLVRTHRLGLWCLEGSDDPATCQSSHEIVSKAMGPHASVIQDGRTHLISFQVMRSFLRTLFATMSSLISKRSYQWQVMQKNNPQIWEYLGVLLNLMIVPSGETDPKICAFLFQAASTNPRPILIYYNVLDGLLLQLERSLTTVLSPSFGQHVDCLVHLIIPFSAASNPVSVASIHLDRYGMDDWREKKKEGWNGNVQETPQSDQTESKDGKSFIALEDRIPSTSPMSKEYEELRLRLANREPVVLSTDFDEAWHPEEKKVEKMEKAENSHMITLKRMLKKKNTRLPSSVYDFSSSTANSDMLEGEEMENPLSAGSSVPSSAPTQGSEEDHPLKSNLKTTDHRPSKEEQETENFDFPIPPQKIARLSRVIMRWLDTFTTPTCIPWNSGMWDQLTSLICFLTMKDVWFRERFFAHPHFWHSHDLTSTANKSALMRLVVLFFRNEALQATIANPKNVVHFTRLLNVHLTYGASEVVPTAVYHMCYVWLSNEKTRLALQNEAVDLIRNSLAIASLSSAQIRAFSNMWLDILEHLVMASESLTTGFKIINCLTQHNMGSVAIDQIAERLYLAKLESTLADARNRDYRSDINTSLAYVRDTKAKFTSSLLRAWIKLWRAGNDMAPLTAALSASLRSRSILSNVLFQKEFEAFESQDSYSANPKGIWKWIEYEQESLNTGSGSPKTSLSAEKKVQPEIIDGAATASSAPGDPSPRSNDDHHPLSSATASSTQPASTKGKDSNSTVESEIREFVMCRFYQAELIATVLHARGSNSAEFYPSIGVKTQLGNWTEEDPLLQLLIGAFTSFDKIKSPAHETLSSSKRYASLIIQEVLERRDFLVRNHPLVILAVLQFGVLNSHLELEYKLYPSLIEIFESVEIEPLRAAAILRDMTRCASRHPEEFCQRVPALPALIHRVLDNGVNKPQLVMEALALLNAISRQPLFASNEVLRDLVLMECLRIMQSTVSSKKLRTYAYSLVFSARHFDAIPNLESLNHLPSVSPKMGGSISPPSQGKHSWPRNDKIEEDETRRPLLLSDHHKAWIGSISSQEDDYVELSLMEEGARPKSNGSPRTGSSLDSAQLGLLASDDEWAEVFKVVDKEEKSEKSSKKDENGDIWRFQFIDQFTAQLLTSSNLTPLAHTTVNSWIDASPSIVSTLSQAATRQQFDALFRAAPGVVTRLLEAEDMFESESVFWQTVASGKSPDGDLNNGPLIGGVLLTLALLPPPLRRQVFFSSLTQDNILSAGTNMLAEHVASMTRWQPYHKLNGVICAMAAMVLLQPVVEDLTGPAAFHKLVEQLPSMKHPSIDFFAEKLHLPPSKSFLTQAWKEMTTEASDLKVKFFPETAECLLRSNREPRSGFAYVTPGEKLIFAAPYRSPVYALIDEPLRENELKSAGRSGYEATIDFNPANQLNATLRIGFATMSALKQLEASGAQLLGEIPGSYSIEQRSGMLLCCGATIATNRPPPTLRTSMTMRVDFYKQTISYGFGNTEASHYYHVWNIDTSETLYPVIGFESSAIVAVATRFLLEKSPSLGMAPAPPPWLVTASAARKADVESVVSHLMAERMTADIATILEEADERWTF